MKCQIKLFRKALLLITGIFLTSTVWADNILLQKINFAALPGNRFEVKMDFSAPPPEPQGYTTDSPSRIVLDLPGVDNALDKKKHALSFENARSAVVLGTPNRTRLILNLMEMTDYNYRIDGNEMIVQVGSEKASVVQAAKSNVAYEQEASRDIVASDTGITDVDFRRGEAGEGLITISLTDPHVNVDIARVGKNIELNFYQTSLPNNLDLRLDVVDFATPVTAVDSSMEGDKTVISIEATGDYDYLAYQSDTEYVVSVKPLTKEELDEQKSRFAFSGEKLSLNFQDIEVRSVLQIIADFTDLNLVASDTVTGNITLRLENVPWDQALDIVLKAKGLDKRQEGTVLMVAPAAEIAEQERLQVEANKQLQELAPLRTEYIRIRYADAKELFELFDVEGDGGGSGEDRTATRSILSERGSAIVDQRTNTIILTDTDEKIAEFRRMVDQIDIPIRQVLIEARIVIANTDFRREMGVKWGVSGIRSPGDDTFIFSGNRSGQKADGVLDAFTIDPSEISDDGTINNDHELTLTDTLSVDLGVSEAAGRFSMGLLTNNTFIDLELSALQNSGDGEIVSQPKVLTGDKQMALIEAGTEVPFLESTSSGSASLKFKEAVLKLEVTPQITPDGRIIMNLYISQDSIGDFVPGLFGSTVPTIDVTHLETQALVGDGQTLVLGGIFQKEQFEEIRKVPFLGDIPVVGKLFTNKLASNEKREILIFITPKILDDTLID